VDGAVQARRKLRRLIETAGHEVHEAGSVAEALSHGLQSFDLVLCDLRLPGKEATSLLSREEPPPVLVMTSTASVRSAVEAMKLGAVDYIAKPPDPDELVLSIERVLRERTLKRCVDALSSDVKTQWPMEPMVGTSAPMQEVLSHVRKVAPTTATVLVLGESGTGKELVARSIHAHSQRSKHPFVAVNCAAIPEGLFESELFGHERGAFTGATHGRDGLVA
jgi:DNA-binding NtrC family response regulator